jgi:site-specific recombinase XerD
MLELTVVDNVDKWRKLKRLVLDSVSSPHTRSTYNMALDEFAAWYRLEPRPGFSRATVNAWRVSLEVRKLGSSSINVRLCAVRKLALEAAQNGLLDHGLAIGILSVKGVKRLGVRIGQWLSLQQAQKLLNQPDVSTLKGLRDCAVLAVLLGCGLRRVEVVALTFAQIQQREGRWCIIDLSGKRGRIRTVPVPSWVKAAIEVWQSAAGLAGGRVFRSIDRSGATRGENLSDKAIFQLVQLHSEAAGLPRLGPHDCRRSCAKLCLSSGGQLDQIQILLGHASIVTTEIYLGGKQNLLHAPNDGIKLMVTYVIH